MKSLFASKKAFTNTRTYFSIISILLVFGFFNILGYSILQTATNSLDTAGYYTGEAKLLMDDYLNTFLFMDYLMVVLLTVLVLGVVYLNYRLATSPAFFVIEFLATAFYGFIAYFYNYLFVQLVSPPFFSAYVELFPLTFLINTNLHWVLLANMVIGGITFFAKREEEPTLLPQQPIRRELQK